MQGEVIKSFLVGLGFEVDEKSLADFNAGLKTAAVRVAAVAAAVTGLYGAAVKGIQSVSEGFEEMGYQYHIIAPAINKAIVLRNEMMKAYSAAGINIRQVIVQSVKLNMSLAKTKFALEAIYKSTASKLFPLLQKSSDAFRKKLYENMPYIISALENLVKYVFKAFEAVTQLGVRLWSILMRIYDFFVLLDKATNGWSTVILGVVAAWKLLNLSFIATPIGALLAGFTALLALFDDYKTYMEGGKSLFNWAPAIPIINAIADGLKKVAEYLRDIGELGFKFSEGIANLLFPGLDKLSPAQGGTAGGASNGNTFPNSVAGAKRGDFGGVNGLIGGTPQTNVNANMQTSISITGSPNADATARLTGQQQSAVNRDFVRNMKGSRR